MAFESDLKAHLQVAAIADIVADRIYPVLRQQGKTVPAMTYVLIGPDAQNNLDGIDASLRQYRVQIDCWSQTYDKAAELSLAVRDRMNTAAASFRSVFIPGTGLRDYEPETKLYRAMLEFNCWYRET